MLVNAYFTMQEGKLDTAKALLPTMVSSTSQEPGCYFYLPVVQQGGPAICFHEAYADADAFLAHVGRAGALIGHLAAMSTVRLEVAGPRLVPPSLFV